MKRRSFLKFAVALGGMSAGHLPLPEAAGQDTQRDVFLVAGVRYNKVRGHVQVGDKLCLRAKTFRREICYEILLNNGQRIGFVPRKLVPLLRNREILNACVSQIQPGAVPWKRYEVAVVTQRIR